MRRVNPVLVAAWFPVALVMGQWEPDIRVTNYPGSGKAITAEPAASVDSFICVVWDDSRDSSLHETYFKRSTDDGATWLDDVRLTPADAYWSPCPAVAAQGVGVHVVWHELRHSQQNPGNEEIYYLRSTDRGDRWESEVRLTTDTAHSWHPRVAVSGDYLHVVWADYRTGYWQVWHKRSTDGGTIWSGDTQLSRGTGIIEVPQVAVGGSGVHVVWQDGRHGINNHEIYYVGSTDNGATWGQELRLTNEAHESYAPVVAASGQNVHVVWVDYRDRNPEAYYRRSTDAGATWSAEANLTNNSSNPGLYSMLPSVAASGNLVHLAWGDDFDGNNEIYYKRSADNGVSWSEAVRLTDDSAVSVTPVVMLSGTEVKVVWPDTRVGPNADLFYKRNPTGNAVAVNEEPGETLSSRLRLIPSPVRNGFARLVPRPGQAEWSRVLASVFDAAGRCTIRSAAVRASYGWYLDLHGLESGVYLVRCETDGQALVQSIVLAR